MAASHTLTVGFDVSPLAGPPGGIGRYVRELFAALGSALPNGAVMPIAHRAPSTDWAGFEGPDGSSAGPGPGFPLRSVWTFGRLPGWLERSGLDLFHGTSYYAPLTGPTPAVVTIHDLSAFSCPQYHPRGRVLRARAVLPRVARRAAAVITPTDAVRMDVLRIFGLPADRVHVVPEAAGPRFGRSPSQAERQATLARHGLEPGFLLSLGTVEPRKNLGRVVEALGRLRDSGRSVQLAVVGREGWKTRPIFDRVRRLGLADQVRFLGFVPDVELPVLMHEAAGLVYPSLCEGFGLPVLEAMAAGLPVVTSHDGALAEVAGGAALLVDPLDPDAIADAMERTFDPAIRALLVQRGRTRAAAFSWERTARETAEVYRRAARERGRIS